MDDSYEGGDSGETTEVSTESSTEVSTAETPETDRELVTDDEIAVAFDEKETVTDPEAEPGAAKTEAPGKSPETPAPEKEPEAELPAPAAEAKTDSPKTSDGSEVIHVNCTREDLAGKEHPETGVPYETKVIELNGKQLEVTVPKFESNFDTKLEEDQLKFSRARHETICNKQLKERCESDPEWAKSQFNEKQLDQIRSGDTPDNFTWHHDGGEVGHMQLVDSEIHQNTRHTGGFAIWGKNSKHA